MNTPDFSEPPKGPALHKQVTGVRPGSTRFPRYDAAEFGFENYWYPAMRARDLGRKPVAMQLFGREIVFFREAGRARARNFEVAERFGILWIYNGAGEPPPVERDIPEEWLRPHAVIEGRITTRPGDWRHAAENGFDEGHAKYLHRSAAIMTFIRMPAYSTVEVKPDDGPWITRKTISLAFEADFPGLGRWPKRRFWKRSKGGSRVSIRLPGLLRVNRGHLLHFEWYVPTTSGNHRYLQFVVQHRKGLRAVLFRLYYWTYFRWIFHVQFNDQDASMVELMQTPPERLYRPDISLIAWRHLCERSTGGDREGLESPEATYTEQEREQFREAMEA